MTMRCFLPGLVVFVSLVLAARGQEDDFLYDVFPPDFLWGVATSSYQIEGGWDADGKGENIWDRFTHEGNAFENQTGDVACNSYNQYAEDIQIISDLEVNYYRFSLSWARIIPDGTLAGGINQAGLDYYNSLIDGLIAAGIEPMVTIYHWDMPQALQDGGGWETDDITPHFVDYAITAFEYFGDRVKRWITFNEPWVISALGYGSGFHAPGVQKPGVGPYRAAHVLLKTHAEVYHTYNDIYRPLQNGVIGITLNSDWKEPGSNDPLDLAAADRAIQFNLGWFAHPIYSETGDYPQAMRDQIDSKSAAQGYPESRLPTFTQEEIDRIKGTSDFFGLNHYTTEYVIDDTSALDCISFGCDQDTGVYKNSSWPSSGSIWLRSVPWGFRSLLNWIRDQYGDVSIYVTENGFSDRNGTLDDGHRVNVLRSYVNNALKAIRLDNVTVKAYTAWSLMDNFEWRSGYVERFGIHYIDFDNDPTLARTPKESARQYTQIIRDNGFPPPPPESSP